jgi:Tol biopolymer transport system component
MKPDGTRHRHLKIEGSACGRYDPARFVSNCCASWAPDGRRLLFRYGVMVNDQFGNLVANQSDFAVADADGSHRTVVPLAPPRPFPNEEFARDGASFAPDGRHFAYYRYALQGTYEPEVWIATVDGREDRRLGPGSSPRWSPDGRTIAYVRPQTGDAQRGRGTWLMSARTGKPLRRLWRGTAASLDWAPDGHRLIASPDLPFPRRGLYILRSDGKAAQPFTSRSRRTRRQLREASDAVWSPNGRRIAYVRDHGLPVAGAGEPDTSVEIWTISTRGTRAKRIWKRTEGFDSETPGPSPLSWQPLPR